MSFNLNENTTYINAKLTDLGRRNMALGVLKLKKLVLLDREVDYSIDRTNSYDILNNRILSPSDSHPGVISLNLDGSVPYNISNHNIGVYKQFFSADSRQVGFFTGSTDDWYWVNNMYYNAQTIAYVGQSFGQNKLVFTGAYPKTGDLVLIHWQAPQNSNYASPTSHPVVPNQEPVLSLWYRVISASTGTNVLVDRPIPDFGQVSHGARSEFYPYDTVDSYFASATTITSPVWNMNIIRTYNVPGSIDVSNLGSKAFSLYGSLDYAGSKIALGFDSSTPAIGILHYTNMNTGQTYGEELIEKSIEVDAPAIMWHNRFSDGSIPNGQALYWGMTMYDSYGVTHYDSHVGSTYRDLRDGKTAADKIVGRVYHKLKLIVITDQELLAAFTYKSNRNYTYPEPIVSLSPNPAPPLTNGDATGLCQSGYTYFVTVLYENTVYDPSESYGYPPALHCGYIKKIEGRNDINGNPQFLKVKFPPNSFPYMRNSSDISSLGNGWMANTVQVLVSAHPNSYNYDEGSVPSDSWVRVSDNTIGGNGVLIGSNSDNVVDPNELNAHEFIISLEDYQSGSTYSLNSGLTINYDYLSFGSELFFYGSVRAQSFKSIYKSVITALAMPNELQTSTNPTFDEYQDSDIYITEMAVLDENDDVVAIGKPTYPLKKGVNEPIGIQINIDF